MNKEQYQAWAEHPQTKQFHQYLKDYRTVIMERWAEGRFKGDDNIIAIAQAQMAAEIVSFDDDTIEQFYATNKVEVKDAE